MENDIAPIRVLVVDDEPIIRMVFSLLFKKAAEVKTVATAEDALQEVRQRLYNLCFLDVVLPGMSGLDAMKIINDVSPQTKVAIMTGSNLDEAMMKQVDAYAFDFIEKPFSLLRIREIANRAGATFIEQ